MHSSHSAGKSMDPYRKIFLSSVSSTHSKHLWHTFKLCDPKAQSHSTEQRILVGGKVQRVKTPK